MVMSYSLQSQIFDPMNDLDKDHFVRVLIRNSYHKVDFFFLACFGFLDEGWEVILHGPVSFLHVL